MNPSEIEDALRGNDDIEPSEEFRAQVMKAVHAHAAVGRSRQRVWRSISSVLAVASVASALLMAVMLLERAETRPGEMTQIARWLSFTLTGTFAIACRTMRRIA